MNLYGVRLWGLNVLMFIAVLLFPPLGNAAGDAADDTAYTAVNTSVTIDVLANDGTLGSSEGIATAGNPAHGTTQVVTVDGKQQIKYIPDTEFRGIDSFSYDLSGGTSATVTVTVDVAAEAGPDQLSVSPGSTVTLDGTASTGPITTYAWTLESRNPTDAPEVTLTDGDKATATFVAPTVTADTTYVFKLTVNGGVDTTSDADTVTIVVKKPAQQLVANAGPDQLSVSPGSTVTLDGTASTGAITTYAWTLESTDPADAPEVTLTDGDKATATFVAPTVTADTAYVFKLTVSGGADTTSDADTVTIVVKKSVQPIANAGTDRFVDESATVTLDGSGSHSTDPNRQIEHYIWKSLDDSRIVLADSVKPTFTAPRVGKGGKVLRFTLEVVDDTGLKSAADEVTITVKNTVNDAPTAVINESADSVKPGAEFTLDGSDSTDPDGDETIKTYRWTQKEGDPLAFEIITGNAAVGRFRAPVISETVQLTLILTVTDEEGESGSVEIPIVVTIDETLKKPVADAGDDISVDVSEPVTLDGSASHDTNADGQIVSYHWRQVKGTKVELTNPDSAKASFTSPAVVPNGFEALEFELKVVDNDNLFDTDRVVVNVGPNKLPDVDAGEDQIDVEEGRTVTLSGKASDEDGTIAKVLWKQIGGNASEQVVFSDPESNTVSFVTPPVEGGKDAITLEFEFIARDNLGGVGKDRVKVIVKDNGITTVPEGLVPVRAATDDESAVGFDIGSAHLVALTTERPPQNERATQKNRPRKIPYGLFDFTLRVDKPGDSATLRIWFPEDMSKGFGWYKYDAPNEVWASYDSDKAVFNGHELLLTLTDGGPGDDDGKADGFIHDPGGPGSVIAKEETHIEGSSGGGAFGGMIALLAAGLGLRRRERRAA